MSYAFVFPGQGSQAVGMGKALAEAYPAARDAFAEADEALHLPISRLCFEGPEEELRLTENTQPAILAVSTAAHRALSAEIPHLAPAFVAGHSLGEYSALVAAGSLAFADALRAVRERGRAMQEAVPPGRGAMAALLGMARGRVEQICRDASASSADAASASSADAASASSADAASAGSADAASAGSADAASTGSTGSPQAGSTSEVLSLSKGSPQAGSTSEVLSLSKGSPQAGSRLVVPANYNSPGQVVIAGTREGVDRALALFRERGGKRAVELPVSAPFHTALMEPAARRMAEVLRDIRVDTPKIPLINNADARALVEKDQIVPSLVRQVVSPVRWEESVEAMSRAGVTAYLELGPGRVLAGLIGRIDQGAAAASFAEPADLTYALSLIGGKTG